MKKVFSLLLSAVLVFSVLPFNASAAESDDIPFLYSVYSDKYQYAKGEEINVFVSLENISLDRITDMRIWMDYPLTGYYLTPGVSEQFLESVPDSIVKKMRVSEDEGVLNIASKFSDVDILNNFLLRLAHAYKTLTLIYTTIRYGIENRFISFNQKKLDLGSVKVMYDNTEIEFSLKCRYSVVKSEANELIKLSDEAGEATAEIHTSGNSYTGLAFAISGDKNSFGLFAVNPDIGKAFVYKAENGKYHLLGAKKVSVTAGKTYKMKVLFSDNRIICHIFDNPHDSDPYPVFDMYYDSGNSGYGVFAKKDGYSGFSVTPGQIAVPGKSYTNPVYENSPDPYILKSDGVYYLYATTDPFEGYSVSSSTDLVNWQHLGFCARKGDIYGNSDFWAPEVYKYNNRYYMLYSTDEHLSVASADAPTGPFEKCIDSYLLEEKCIDGHLLFDDDGAVYLYMAYWGETGEEIWGCRMNDDLCGVDRETLTQLTECQNGEGRVNEGPFMMKYKGKYYLTYSVNGYTDHNYSVKLAVSNSPLGTYEGKGTILEKSGPLVGTGHHSFIESPDGEELFIAYHCHYSTTRIHDRKLCIDRCKFVETDDGYTISVYGPTSTAQPYPSDRQEQ